MAVLHGRTAAVQALLDEDPGLVEAESESGLTPLMSAVQWGQRGVLTVLLRAGADPAVATAQGQTAGDMAKLKMRRDLLELLGAVRGANNPGLNGIDIRKGS